MAVKEVREAQSLFWARRIALRVFRNEEATRIIILGVIVALFAALTNGQNLTPGNVGSVIIQSTQCGAGAIGIGIVIIGGGIDLSAVGIGLGGGAIFSRLLTPGSLGKPGIAEGLFANPVSLGVGILVFLLIGIAFGMANGALVTFTGADPLIMTWAVGMIGSGIAYFVIQPFSNVANLPLVLATLADGTTGGVPNPVILFAAVTAIAYFFMTQTTFGKQVYAIGGNPVAARLSAIPVKRVQMMTYMVSGFLAALAGIMLVSRSMTFSLILFGDFWLWSLTATLLGGARLGGGKGSIIGIAIGVLILGFVNNGMNLVMLHHTLQNMTRGGLIVAVVGIDHWVSRYLATS